jgi:threonyl-tRNA synthetase
MVDNEGKKRQKYDIHFTDIDGIKKYPVILHNSPTGGLERILWGLIETAIRDKDKKVPGFRTWLSPIQVRILAISNEQHDYAEKILEILSKESYRVDFDDRNEKLGKKIRQSEIDWIPYTIILGKKEQEDQTISIRKRLIGHPRGPKKETSKNVNNVKLSELIEMLNEDTKGFPKHKLPKPFRKFSTKVYFRK